MLLRAVRAPTFLRIRSTPVAPATTTPPSPLWWPVPPARRFARPSGPNAPGTARGLGGGGRVVPRRPGRMAGAGARLHAGEAGGAHGRPRTADRRVPELSSAQKPWSDGWDAASSSCRRRSRCRRASRRRSSSGWSATQSAARRTPGAAGGSTQNCTPPDESAAERWAGRPPGAFCLRTTAAPTRRTTSGPPWSWCPSATTGRVTGSSHASRRQLIRRAPYRRSGDAGAPTVPSAVIGAFCSARTLRTDRCRSA